MTTRKKALIVGCGYAGERLARRLAPTHEVTGCVTSAARARQIASSADHTLVLDLDSARPAPLPPAAIRDAAICHLVPPPREGERDPRTAHLLALLTEPPRIFLYLSTTGVYGDHGGGEVTEATPINPSTPRARRRADAESRITAWCADRAVRCVVLRVPGIYGPQRLPLERLRRAEPVLEPGSSGAGNRIHVEDLVTACALVIRDERAHGIYNVGDGNHASTAEYFTMVARLAGLSVPPRVSLAEARRTLTPQMLTFLEESRCVSTRRIREELGFVPRYGDLEAGIRQSLLDLKGNSER